MCLSTTSVSSFECYRVIVYLHFKAFVSICPQVLQEKKNLWISKGRLSKRNSYFRGGVKYTRETVLHLGTVIYMLVGINNFFTS